MKVRLVAHVFDRATRQWSSIEWPSLPRVEQPRAVLGPDDRLYVFVPATQGQPPEGGWPTGPDGEAEDADAEGDTYHLWSVSLTDSSDVRDEALTVGDLAFTDTSMVWTDSTNGDAGLVHVRDLSTGEEHSFDPHAGERCNLLSFGATDDRVVLGQYCGTYAGGVRDDRVQILTTDGDQVVTLQDSGIDGAVAGPGGTSDVVTVTAYEDDRSGTYVYDLGTDRFLRISDAVSSGVWAGRPPTGSSSGTRRSTTATAPPSGSASSCPDRRDRPDRPSGPVVVRRAEQLRGEHGRLGPALQAELGQDAGDVVLDGLLGQEHLLADLPVGQALGDEAEQLELLLGQVGQLGRGRRGRCVAGRGPAP